MPVFATDDTIAVFPFKLYNIIKDEYVVSKRLGTAQTIERIGAVIAGPHFSIPTADVDGDGLTKIGYNGYEKRVP
jgi:hypothetical protein